MVLRLPLVAAAAALLQGAAAIRFSRVFGDHMVLQRGVPAVVWGFDTPGTTVTTTFQGVQYTNVTGADGIFRQRLPPQLASAAQATIAVSSSTGTASVSDVLFGDLFVCGGQSNMQFSVSAGLNATAEIAAANYPNIRVFTVGQGTSSPTPLADLVTIEQNWTAATPASIGGAGPGPGDFQYFSAICYFFGRNLYNELGGAVPIGLISNNWGGTCLASWAPEPVDQACGNGGPPTLYNAMINPYTVGPMPVTGFLWSQGECDADANNTAFYACAFPRFIQSWRNAFAVPDAFFGFELLPAYISDSTFSPASLPYERAAQLSAMTAGLGGKVVVANGMDLGDAQAPHGSVHPRNKQTVAQRFTAAALPLLYGRPGAYLNPAYSGAAAVTSGTTLTVTVSFDPASVGTGLTIIPSACPTSVGVPQSECAWHAVQTTDGQWYNATAAVSGDGSGLVLTATVPAGAVANATSSSFSPWPVVTVYNTAGFPALPWYAAVDSAEVVA